jgi:hypothetical protein
MIVALRDALQRDAQARGHTHAREAGSAAVASGSGPAGICFYCETSSVRIVELRRCGLDGPHPL